MVVRKSPTRNELLVSLQSLVAPPFIRLVSCGTFAEKPIKQVPIFNRQSAYKLQKIMDAMLQDSPKHQVAIFKLLFFLG
jgi:hypothetical protein